MPSSRHAAFTLLEICLALAIGVMIIALSVPSIAGLLAEQRLKASFERFDKLAATARVRSVTEQRAYALVWDREGITLEARERADEMRDGEDSAEPARLVFSDKETFDLRRPAALSKKPSSEWTFWRNGTCEPAEVSYRGAGGRWVVRYDSLTARSTFLSSELP